MPNPKARPATPPTIAAQPLSLSPLAQHFIAAISVFTALLAAGSCGLIGHPLRHALSLAGLLVIAIIAISNGPGLLRRIAILALFFLLSAYLVSSSLMIVCALGVVVLLGGVTMAHPDSQFTLRPIVFAIFIFALCRFAHDGIGSVWLAADHVAEFIATIGGAVAGRPLDTGATFASLDGLILMIALAIAQLTQSPRPRLRRGALFLGAILVAQLLYLIILARCFDLLDDIKSLTIASIDITPDGLVTQLKDQIPWNLPLLAAIFQAIVAFFLLRWSPTDSATAAPRRTSIRLTIATAALATVLPMSSSLCLSRLDLTGKTIVFYKQGFLNWEKPHWGEYGRLSQGMYGLLANSSTDMSDGVGGTGSRFIELFGGTAIVSPDLSDDDLKKADALVMMYPDKPWELCGINLIRLGPLVLPNLQHPWKSSQLDRVRNYVKSGGTLLLFGEHTVEEKKNDPDPNRPRWPDEAIARFNDLLVDSNMRVRFDTAVFTIGGWLQSYESIAHPMTLGVRDDRNEFGVVIGASLNVKWPAQPLIVGRFGNADPGDPGRADHAMLSNEKYDPGERLGDVILAAEQRVGKGRIVLFGDTSMMSNGLLHGCYDYNAKLLAYVADRNSTPQALWRQSLTLLLALALFVIVILQPHPIRIAACALLLAASISVCTQISFDKATQIPGPRDNDPKTSKLVYMDTTHMEAASLESWREEGLMGLQLCFEREGYMTLALEDFTKERLDRAGVLVSVAPTKPFTDDERAMIRDWVSRGGILICTAGFDRVAASQPLLEQFGLYVGVRPGEPAPEPLGWFKSPFLDLGSYKPHVRFWAAWPLTFNSVQDQPDPQAIALWGDQDQVAIYQRNFGKGKVVLAGDTEFAMNKNLEREGGQPFENMRENADFWRWFIEHLNETEHPWTPTDPTTQATTQPTASIEGEVTR